jgi:hypothetical protein
MDLRVLKPQADMRLWDYVRLENIAFLLLFWGFWRGGSRF